MFQELTDDKLRVFSPCIETVSDTAFITRKPIDIITSGDYNKVPMIIGYNSNEGLMILLDDMKPGSPPNPEIVHEHFIPQQLNLHDDSELKKEILKKLQERYSNERPGDRFLVSII